MHIVDLQEDSKASENTGEDDGQAVALTQVGHSSSGAWLIGGVCCGGTAPAGAGRRKSGLGRATAGSS